MNHHAPERPHAAPPPRHRFAASDASDLVDELLHELREHKRMVRLLLELVCAAAIQRERDSITAARTGDALAAFERGALIRAIDGEDMTRLEPRFVPGPRAAMLGAINVCRELGHAPTRARVRAGAIAIFVVALGREQDALVALAEAML